MLWEADSALGSCLVRVCASSGRDLGRSSVARESAWGRARHEQTWARLIERRLGWQACVALSVGHAGVLGCSELAIDWARPRQVSDDVG